MRPLPSDITKCNYFTQYKRDIETKKIVRKNSAKWRELSTFCTMIASEKIYWDNFDVVKRCITRLAHKHKITEVEYIQIIKDELSVVQYIDRLLSYNNICKGIENIHGTCWINASTQFLLGIDEIANEEIYYDTLTLTQRYKKSQITYDILQSMVEKTCPARPNVIQGKINGTLTSKDLSGGHPIYIISPIIRELKYIYPKLFSMYTIFKIGDQNLTEDTTTGEISIVKYDTKYIIFLMNYSITEKKYHDFNLHNELIKRNYELRAFIYDISLKNETDAHVFTVRMCNSKYQLFDDHRVFDINKHIVEQMMNKKWDYNVYPWPVQQDYFHKFYVRGVTPLLYVKKDIE